MEIRFFLLKRVHSFELLQVDTHFVHGLQRRNKCGMGFSTTQLKQSNCSKIDHFTFCLFLIWKKCIHVIRCRYYDFRNSNYISTFLHAPIYTMTGIFIFIFHKYIFSNNIFDLWTNVCINVKYNINFFKRCDVQISTTASPFFACTRQFSHSSLGGSP